ncbi:hypothetical protein Tco_0866665 [Tanacetum coccineum]
MIGLTSVLIEPSANTSGLDSLAGKKTFTATDNSTPIRSGPTSYAKLVIGESSRKDVKFRTLISPTGNKADVAIPLESIRAISERFANTTYGFFLGKWVACPGRSSYARVMIELRTDEELKDTIVVDMPKLVSEGFNMCTVRVEYEWKRPRPVSNKNGASTSGKKKQAEVSRQENSLVLTGTVDRGLITNCLLGTWRETKQDDDYDPYNDDLYESHDMSDHLQAICDDLDIMVRGRKKK